MERNFDSFFNSLQEEQLKKIWEAKKIENSKIRKIEIPIIIIVNILIVYFSIKDNDRSYINFLNFISIFFSEIPTLFIVDVFILVFFSIIYTKKDNMYNKIFKEKVMYKIFENFLNDVEYVPKKQMPKSIYKEGKYEKYENKYYSDDYVEGKIDDKYLIKMAEITTKYNNKGNNPKDDVTIFSGLFAKIDIGKSINNELRIELNKTIQNNKRLEMDSEEFEEYFDVFSTNKIIGMQILTHDIMDMLVNFRNQYKILFDILIINDSMYIRLHVGNMFEAELSSDSVINKRIVERYFYIVNFIYSLSKKMIHTVEETEI